MNNCIYYGSKRNIWWLGLYNKGGLKISFAFYIIQNMFLWLCGLGRRIRCPVFTTWLQITFKIINIGETEMFKIKKTGGLVIHIQPILCWDVMNKRPVSLYSVVSRISIHLMDYMHSQLHIRWHLTYIWSGC